MTSAAAAMHHDPRYWHRPDDFLPERWLDHRGKFMTKKEGFLPFGVGKFTTKKEGFQSLLNLHCFPTNLYL